MSKNVPDQWKLGSLGALADITMGQSPPSDTYNVERIGLPFFQGKTDFGSTYPIPRIWCSHPTKVAEKGSILFCVRAPVGDVNIANVESCIGRGLAAIKGNKVDQSFLYQSIQFNSPKFKLLAQGSTFEAVSGSEVRDFELLLPPLVEQKKIATILTAVDEVIESTQAQINKLKDLKTGMMQELLSKGIAQDGKPHTEFKDSPVGRIPKAWGCLQLSQAELSVIDGDRGSEYPKDSDYFQREFCLFLSAKNVTKSGFQFEQCSFITREKDQKLRKGKLQRGDIVITTRGSVGNIAFYDNSVPYDHVRINSGMAIIRNIGNRINSEFLDQLLHSRMLGEQIETLAFGSAQPQLTISVIQGLWLPIPALQEQQKIVDAMSGIVIREKSLSLKLMQTINLKKALMHDLLTGAIRVST